MSDQDEGDQVQSTPSSSDCSCTERSRRVLMVRRLHPSVNMQELLTRFSSCGTITGCKVFTHKSGRSAGCASVEFASHQQACTALNTMHGTVLCGKAIHVEWFDANAAVSPHHPTATEFKPSSFGSSSSSGGTSTRLLQHLLHSNSMGASSGGGSSSSLLRQASEPLRSSVPCSPGAAGGRRRPSGASGIHPFASKGGSRTGLDSLNGPSSSAAAAAAAALANAMNPAAQSLAALQLLAAAMQPVGLPPMGTPPRVSPLSLSHQHSCPATSLQHLLAQHNWSAAAAAAAAAGGMGGGNGTGFHHPLSPMGGHHGSSSSLLSSSAPGGASLLTRRHSNYTGSSSAAHDAVLAAALSSPLGGAAHPHHTAAAMAAATAAAQQQAHNWQAAQQQQQQHQHQHQQHALLLEQQLLMQAQAQAMAAAASGGLTRSATSPAELLSEALASLKFLGGEAPASPHGGPPLSPLAAASLLQQHQQGSGGMHGFPASTGGALGSVDAPAMSAAAAAAAAAVELLASTTAGPLAGGGGGSSSSSALLSPFAALAPLMDPAGAAAAAALEAGRGTSTAGMLPSASGADAAAAAADALLRSHSQQLRHVMPPVSGLLAPSLSNLDAMPTAGGGSSSDEGAWQAAAARRASAPDSYPGMLPQSPGAAEAAARLLQAPGSGAKDERWGAGEGSGQEAPTGSWAGSLPPLRGLNVRRRLQPLPSDDLSVNVDTGVGALLGGGGAGAVCSSPPVSPQVLSPHDPVSPPPSGSPWLVSGGGSQGGGTANTLARRDSLPSPLFGTGTGDSGDAVFPFDPEEVVGTPNSSSWGNMGPASGAQEGDSKAAAAAAAAAGMDMGGEGPSSPLIGTQVSPVARHRSGHALRGVGFGSFCGDLCMEDHGHALHTLSGGSGPSGLGDSSGSGMDVNSNQSSAGVGRQDSRSSSSDSCQGPAASQNGPSAVSGGPASGVLPEALRQGQQQQPRSPGASKAGGGGSDADLQLLQAAAATGADGGSPLLPGQRMLCRHASLGTHGQQQHSGWGMEGGSGAAGHCTAVGRSWGGPGGEGGEAWHPHAATPPHLLSSLAEMSPEQLQRELASAADSCFARAAGGTGAAGGGGSSGGWSGPQSLPTGGLQGLTRHISMQLDAAVGRLGGPGSGYGAGGAAGAGGGTFDWDSSKLEFPGFFSPPPKNLAGDAAALDMPVFFGAAGDGMGGHPWQQRLPGGGLGPSHPHQLQQQMQHQQRRGGMAGRAGANHAQLSSPRFGERESEDSDVGVVATVSTTSGGLDAAREAADKVAAGEAAARDGMRTLLRSSSSRY